MRRGIRAMTWLLLLVAILSGCMVEGQPDLQQVSDVVYTAFIHVNVVTMTSEIIIEDQTVLIEGDRIIAVGPGSAVSIPENAMIIEGEGAYLMPGLADMHMHTRQDWEDRNIWPVHPLNLYLANGVTTIRDFAPQGSPLTYALQWRDEIRVRTRSGPTIYASGKLLYASPLGDPEGIVHQNYDLGFDFLKLYSYLSKEDYHRAMQTAKALGMYTAGHIPYAVGLDGVLAEGMDEIAHVEELLPEFLTFDRDNKLTPEEWLPYIVEASFLQWDFTSGDFQADFETDNLETMVRISDQIRSADVSVCTTMVVDDVIQLKLFQPEAFLERLENIYFERGYLGSFSQGEEKHQVQFKGIEDLAAFKYGIDRWVLVELQKAGILLLLGTDSGTGGMGIVPGYSIHDELRILVENGFSPYEAIAAGTVNASVVAEQMVGERDFGTVEVGKRADLLLVNENPLESIDAIRDLRGVMSAGRWFFREALDQMIAID